MSTIYDKKLHDQINRGERIKKVLIKDNKKNLSYLEQEPEGYIVAENENEKILKISQDYLKSTLPKYNTDNIFDLNLNYGPYHLDFTGNGSHLLIVGEKGHISMIEWRSKDLLCEFNVDQKISNCKFLHNENMFAVSQKNELYIYDKQGIELHALDYFPEPQFLEFLPHHFLLVAALKNKCVKLNIT